MEPVLISLAYRRPLAAPHSLEVLDPLIVTVPPVREMGQQLAVKFWLSEVFHKLLFPP